MKEVAPGIYIETNYPPYTLTLIATSSGGILVDLPPRVSHARAWLNEVRAVTERIRYVVLTDASRDRLLALTACDLPVVGTETMLRLTMAWDERPWREFLQDMVLRYPEEAGEITQLRSRRPTLAFSGALTLCDGSHIVRLEAVCGAAPGSMMVEVPAASLLIAGDTVAVDEPPPLDSTPDSKAWLETLAALSRRSSIHWVIPGRGSAPVLRCAIEQERELLRIMRRTARSLAKGTLVHTAQTAQDVGQAFFNATGQKAVKQIKAGLEHLVEEVNRDKQTDLSPVHEHGDES